MARVAAAIAFAAFAAAEASRCAFSVSPGNFSLFDAKSQLRSILQGTGHVLASDHVICIHPGRYDVSRTPLTFGPEDSVSGDGRVVWKAVAPGVTISGGVAVTGWEPTTLGGASVFVAPVPAGFAPGAVVRQLWVAGARASRTITDATSVFGTATPWQSADAYTAGFIVERIPAAWSINRCAKDEQAGVLFPFVTPHMLHCSTTSIEFTWPIVLANWIAPRCTIAAISGLNITLASPCSGFLVARNVYHSSLPAPVTAEAAPQFPLGPGVFYHDAEGGLLYYALGPGQTAADLACVGGLGRGISSSDNPPPPRWPQRRVGRACRGARLVRKRHGPHVGGRLVLHG